MKTVLKVTYSFLKRALLKVQLHHIGLNNSSKIADVS